MEKFNKNELIAAIEIGMAELKFIICEINALGEIIILENLNMPSNIEKDVCADKKIAVNTIQHICKIINGFVNIMKEYDIKRYRAVATTGVREACNREYVLEQIKSKTGISIEIINTSEERFLLYKALYDITPELINLHEDGTIIVSLDSIGVNISAYSKSSLKFTEYIDIGSIQLNEDLCDLEQYTLNYSRIIEEYIESKIYFLRNLIKEIHAKNYIVLGEEALSIRKLCKYKSSNESFVSKKELLTLNNLIGNMTVEQIIERYEIQSRKVESLILSLTTLTIIFNMTNAKGMVIPMIFLPKGVIGNMVDEEVITARKEFLLREILDSSIYIANKFKIDGNHVKYVESLALHIFDNTKLLHKLREREKLYLQIATILYEIGRYIGLYSNEDHSNNIIKSQNIIGLSNDEISIIACIVKYQNNKIQILLDDEYLSLNYENRIIVSKLCSILKLANSLDISRKQKIDKYDVSIESKYVYFRCKTSRDILLEQCSFNSNAVFFEEVMGSKPMIISEG